MPSRLGPRRATVILATKLGSSSRADDISFAEQSNASGVGSMPWHNSRQKPTFLFDACAVITRTKILSFASSKVSAVVLTWPVMDNDDCTPYCRLLQLATEKIIFHETSRWSALQNRLNRLSTLPSHNSASAVFLESFCRSH